MTILVQDLAQDLGQDLASTLRKKGEPPCLSLYQPTSRHHPEKRQDPIRFVNLVKSLEQSLAQRYPRHEADGLLAPFRELAANAEFWRHTADGLAVLGARDQFHVYRLQREVPPLAVVADSFHTKPLLRIRQSMDRFQVLAINRKSVSLYEGNRDVLDEVVLAEGVPRTITDALGSELTEPHQTVGSYGAVRGAHSHGHTRHAGGAHSAMHHGHGARADEVDLDTERFFRAVDRAILQHHSQRAKLPLILAALPEHHETFRRISHNPFLLPHGIDVHPSALASLDALRERAWTVLAPRYEARLRELADAFGTARAHQRGDDSLEAVAQAAVAGRVRTLLVDAHRQIPGRIHAQTGHISHGAFADPGVDDVLDDLGELVASFGGDVVVVPTEHMPTSTGVAAIYRFSDGQGAPSPENDGASASARALEAHTVGALYQMARTLNIRGRSGMRKAELVAAIREARAAGEHGGG